MKIAIDISQVIYGTGVSIYVKELVRELLIVDKENEYILIGGSLRRKSELVEFTNSLRGNFTTKFFPISPIVADVVWNRLHTLPVENLIGKVDILHTSDWSEPPTKAAHKVTTIHDLTPFKYSETTKRIRDVHIRKVALSRIESKEIIVPSKSTKRDLNEMGFDEAQISVIYEAPSSEIEKQKSSLVLEVKQKFRVNGNYLLTIGTAERKNLSRLIEVFKEGSLRVDYLVIVGDGQNEGNIIYTGYVSDQELSALYSGAIALVYISLYEGFGLPILEAYKIGVPVVTSNLGSMKEIAGNAAVLVDPRDKIDISRGIVHAIKISKSLSAKGLIRVKDFSWTEAARETIKIYERANS